MSGGASIRVSADEVLRMAQWLLRARGVHSGNEDEPAAAVLWLAARLDGVLQALSQELERGALARGRDALPAPRIALAEPGHRVSDVNGASALTLGPALLDWLDAAPAGSVLEVAALCSPGWLLPHLEVRQALRPLCIDVRALDARGAPALVLGRDGQGGTRVQRFRPWHSLWGLRAWVRLARESPDPGRDPRAVEELDVSCLDARGEAALCRGLQVDRRLWRALGEASAEAMVPESPASRDRGAGGGDDNT